MVTTLQAVAIGLSIFMRDVRTGSMLVGGLLAASISLVMAQSPQRTSASYDDWTVRCETLSAPAQKSCEIVPVVQMQAQANPLSQIAIGRATKNEPLKIVFQLPL